MTINKSNVAVTGQESNIYVADHLLWKWRRIVVVLAYYSWPCSDRFFKSFSIYILGYYLSFHRDVGDKRNFTLSSSLEPCFNPNSLNSSLGPCSNSNSSNPSLNSYYILSQFHFFLYQPVPHKFIAIYPIILVVNSVFRLCVPCTLYVIKLIRFWSSNLDAYISREYNRIWVRSGGER